MHCVGSTAIRQDVIISPTALQLRMDSCLSNLFLSSGFRALRDTPDLKKLFFFPSQEHNKPLSKQSVVNSDECMQLLKTEQPLGEMELPSKSYKILFPLPCLEMKRGWGRECFVFFFFGNILIWHL